MPQTESMYGLVPGSVGSNSVVFDPWLDMQADPTPISPDDSRMVMPLGPSNPIILQTRTAYE